VGALDNLSFSTEELDRIDHHAVEGGIDLWRGPATS
jgi:L-glyceraldehyde 3-phosphate reductase